MSDILLDGWILPKELIWQDEHEWSKVRASTKRTIQGKHIVRENQVPSETGRNVTLTSDDAWLPREDIIADNIIGANTLREWSDQLGKQMVLTMHDSRVYLVRFRHWEQPPMSAEMLVPTAYPEDLTQYRLLLRFAVI